MYYYIIFTKEFNKTIKLKDDDDCIMCKTIIEYLKKNKIIYLYKSKKEKYLKSLSYLQTESDLNIKSVGYDEKGDIKTIVLEDERYKLELSEPLIPIKLL